MVTLKSICKNYWPLLVLFLSTFLVVWPTLTPGYFSHHDDLQVMRVFEMRKCFEDFQIPCRWVPDMGYGNGYPLFNYYGVFPYYIGGLLTYIFGFVGAAKSLFFLSLFIGVFGMYFLANELFGMEIGLLAAILFEFAPYRALDSYVRGDIGETLAISLFPYLFFFSLKLIKKKGLFYFVLFTITLAIFLTTHNIMIMLFMPILIVWIIFWLLKTKQKHIWQIGLSFLIAIGLAAFFLGPAFLEKGLVQTDNLIIGDLNFRAHFVTFNQLFIDRFWGYGASVPGDNDSISFQIGWPLWPLVLVSVIIVTFRSVTSRTKNLLFFLLTSIFVLSLLMTHNKSAFIWEKLPLLAYVQFPWRFLAITIFIGSILGVWWIQYLPKKFRLLLVAATIGLILILNYSYFAPEKFYPNMNDQQKLSGAEWENQQKASILDYLPNGANKPAESAQLQPFLMNGAGTISNYKNYTNHFNFDASVTDQSLVEIPILDFPNWTTYVDGVRISHSNENYLKRLDLTLGPGSYQISGKLENTPIRIVANLITLLTIIFFIFICLNEQIRKRFS